MKVGDYVRTVGGFIGKVISKKGSCTTYRIPNMQEYDVLEIIKSSPNIIDLIEVGDYVNGDKICEIIEKGQISVDGEKVKEKCFCVNNNYRFKLYNDEIKNVVTKEQFESIQYHLESEVN